jgi:cytoskeleton protein RodZ
VAAQTRIQALYFEAIEKDETASLPGGFFYRSFVRQYARLLDLPPHEYEDVLERHLLDEQMSIAAQPTSLHERPLNVPPLPTGMTDPGEETRRWLLRLGGLALVILVCSVIYSLSLNWKNWFGGLMPEAAPAPPVAQAPAPEKQDAPPPAQAAPQTEPQTETPQPAGQQPQAEPAAATPPAPEPMPAAATPKAEPAPPASDAPVTLSIKAIDAAWVQVRDSGKVVYSNVIPIGETRSFSSSGKLRVLFGNAGGVELLYNGRPMPAPGPRGQVRTVEYSATGAELIVKPATLATPPPAPNR